MEVRDITSSRVCFGLWGPRARDILSAVTRDDVSNAGFPYLTAREITVGFVPVLALRVTYVGELGWELYAPTEYGRVLWASLWEAGREHGLVAGGYRAIEALRLEKGYRVWSSDITPDETPFDAGLGFAVDARQIGPALAHDALVAAKAAGPGKRLRCLVLDDPLAVALGNEPVRVDGEVVGRVTSGGYGFAVERSIAYAYLPPDVGIGTRGEIELFGEWVGFEVVREPLYDPRTRGSAHDRRPHHTRRGRLWAGVVRLAPPWHGRRAPGLARGRDRGVRRGGRFARQHFRRDLQITTKPDRTFVTQADTAIEARIRARLADAFPDHGLVGEEYGTEAGEASVRWYIDPIDGTHNYIRGVPLFGTLLAVERDGELQAAVMSAPALDERWWAHRGGGAWARNRGEAPRRIAVSGVADLADAQILYGSGRDIVASGLAPGFDDLLRDVWRERGFGDFWGYALLAEGAAEGVVEVGLSSWDAAAPTSSSRRPAVAPPTSKVAARSIQAPSWPRTGGCTAPSWSDFVRGRLRSQPRTDDVSMSTMPRPGLQPADPVGGVADGVAGRDRTTAGQRGVVAARTQTGGFSPGVAERLEPADGRRVSQGPFARTEFAGEADVRRVSRTGALVGQFGE